MTKESKINLDRIEDMPASELAKLSFAQLNDFIREAEQICHDAQIIISLLTAVKRKKARIAHAAGAFKGGASE